MECVLDMGYFHLTDEEAEMKQTEDIIASLRDDDFYKSRKRALLLISVEVVYAL